LYGIRKYRGEQAHIYINLQRIHFQNRSLSRRGNFPNFDYTQKLKEKMSDFNMEEFGEMIKTRKDQIDEDLLDLFVSFSDFNEFKEIMLCMNSVC
jgi:hypothetical protein